MFDFLHSNFAEILTVLISVVATIIPIPFTLRELLKKHKEVSKNKIEIRDAQNKLVELEISKNNLDELVEYINKINENKSNDNSNSQHQQKPPKFDFNIKSISPKKITLDELYEKRNTDKFFKKISFFLAVIMSIIGTTILFVGIIISLFYNKEIGWITTSSGAIIELVAGVYFWLVNRTMKEVRENSKQLEKTEDLLTAMELAEKINNADVRDEAYKIMIDKLI